MKCGLRLPYNKFLKTVLHHFQLKVQHISSNSFILHEPSHYENVYFAAREDVVVPMKAYEEHWEAG